MTTSPKRRLTERGSNRHAGMLGVLLHALLADNQPRRINLPSRVGTLRLPARSAAEITTRTVGAATTTTVVLLLLLPAVMVVGTRVVLEVERMLDPVHPGERTENDNYRLAQRPITFLRILS